MDTVKRLGEEKPVVIFSKTSSRCVTHTTKTLICDFGANPKVYELDEFSNKQQMERALLDLGCNPSVPAVFIGKRLVGGAKEVISLSLTGELKQLLIHAGAIWV